MKSISRHHSVRHPKRKIFRDLLILAVSIGVAIFILQSGIVDMLTSLRGGNMAIESFIAGFFFTSAFTIAPASVVLADIAQTASPYSIAFWGAIGSMFGDLVLFIFIRDTIAEDITDLVKHSPLKRFLMVFRLRFFRWLTPLIGALVIASPLPDELGLAMMGLSKTRKVVLMPIAFCMSYIGILALCLIARAI